jgi:outer membrane protein
VGRDGPVAPTGAATADSSLVQEAHTMNSHAGPHSGAVRIAIGALTAAVALAVTAPRPAAGQDFDRVIVRTHISAIFLDAKSAPPTGMAGLDLDVSNTVTVGADLTVFATPTVAFNLLAAFISPHVTSGPGGLDASLGSVDALPPVLTVQYHFMPGEKFRPYLGVGGSWVTFFDNSGDLENLNVDIGDAFGLVGQGGFNAYVTDHLAVMLDFRYVEILNNPDVNVNGTLTDKLDFRHYILSGGVGFSF